jgi:hypothetical protein
VDLARRLEGLGAIGCDTRHIKIVGQHFGHAVQDLAVVVDEKNSRPLSCGGPRDAREWTVHGASIAQDPAARSRFIGRRLSRGKGDESGTCRCSGTPLSPSGSLWWDATLTFRSAQRY